MKCSRCGCSEPNQSCYVCALSDEEIERRMEHEELAVDHYREVMLEERLYGYEYQFPWKDDE